MDIQPGEVLITYADIGKAKKLLGYEPKTDVEEGVKEFVKWYKGYYNQK
jgi:UDP-glucuronate 4-epimerase